MPSTPYLDIEAGSYLVRGIADVLSTRAQRQALVTGLSVGTEAEARARINQAITQVITDAGSVYPDGTHKPPLQGARGLYWGTDKAIVDAQYYYTATSNPTKPSFQFAPERRSYIEEDWVVMRKVDGGSSADYWEVVTTEGTFTEDDGTLDIDPVRIKVPVYTILVPIGRVVPSQLEGLEDLYGYCNTESVTINGRCRKPFTVKFMGFDTIPINENGTIKHYAVAEFEWLATAWGRWRITSYYTSTPDGTFERRWNVRFDDPYYSDDLVDAFPEWNPDASSGAGDFETGPDSGSCTSGS